MNAKAREAASNVGPGIRLEVDQRGACPGFRFGHIGDHPIRSAKLIEAVSRAFFLTAASSQLELNEREEQSDVSP